MPDAETLEGVIMKGKKLYGERTMTEEFATLLINIGIPVAKAAAYIMKMYMYVQTYGEHVAHGKN